MEKPAVWPQLTSHARYAKISKNESRYVMIDVKEGHLVELFPQHKAYRLDELNPLEHVGEVQKFNVAEVLEARHVTLPQEVPLVPGAEDVDEKVDTREHLEHIVHGQECLELVRLATFHETVEHIELIRSHLRPVNIAHPGPTRSIMR